MPNELKHGKTMFTAKVEAVIHGWDNQVTHRNVKVGGSEQFDSGILLTATETSG